MFSLNLKFPAFLLFELYKLIKESSLVCFLYIDTCFWKILFLSKKDKFLIFFLAILFKKIEIHKSSLKKKLTVIFDMLVKKFININKKSCIYHKSISALTYFAVLNVINAKTIATFKIF